MAIHELFDQDSSEMFNKPIEHQEEGKGSFFSTLVTRFFFLLLLIADLAWFAYTCISLLILVPVSLALKKRSWLKKPMLNLQRSSACGISLFVGLFSPPFGIMVACTYFLMYDKAGMEEVVPAPLQAQFKDIFTTDQ
ncbi:MAG: hypothetical protein P0S96_06570 [Simkaniaceae bacterium]|nr:hypothetical protein [Candidatus Sacchlamyda saccharinae]